MTAGHGHAGFFDEPCFLEILQRQSDNLKVRLEIASAFQPLGHLLDGGEAIAVVPHERRFRVQIVRPLGTLIVDDKLIVELFNDKSILSCFRYHSSRSLLLHGLDFVFLGYWGIAPVWGPPLTATPRLTVVSTDGIRAATTPVVRVHPRATVV